MRIHSHRHASDPFPPFILRHFGFTLTKRRIGFAKHTHQRTHSRISVTAQRTSCKNRIYIFVTASPAAGICNRREKGEGKKDYSAARIVCRRALMQISNNDVPVVRRSLNINYAYRECFSVSLRLMSHFVCLWRVQMIVNKTLSSSHIARVRKVQNDWGSKKKDKGETWEIDCRFISEDFGNLTSSTQPLNVSSQKCKTFRTRV